MSTWEVVEMTIEEKNLPTNKKKEKAVFLDRDGVLIEDVNYLSRVEQISILDGVEDGLLRLQDSGFHLVVTTNQAGIARALFTESTLNEIHSYLDNLFKLRGIHVSMWNYCPHHPSIGTDKYKVSCPCRKPEPGMLLKASSELNLDLEKSYLIGDKISDIEAANRVMVKSILVRTGYGLEHEKLVKASKMKIFGIVKDFLEATNLILVNDSFSK